MTAIATPAEQRDHFISLLKNLRTAMLVTHHGENGFHARPMAIAGVEADGFLWFFTATDTLKVHEIEDDLNVHLTAQDGDSTFIALSGHARLVADRAKIAELWSEPFRVWFPGGKDDPTIELIGVRPTVGEFWDNSGLNRAKYLWEAAKAYVSGTTPTVEEGEQHGVAQL